MKNDRSVCDSTLPSTGAVKLGQPVPDSNLSSERNSASPHPAQRSVPRSLACAYSPVNARSVPFLRSTWYCSGVSCCRHSASLFSTFIALGAFVPPVIVDGLLSQPSWSSLNPPSKNTFQSLQPNAGLLGCR